ncbi:MAG: tyrosine-type recombinase/integrase [Anaerolineales bacterium]|jgi:integrase/recombinase XerC
MNDSAPPSTPHTIAAAMQAYLGAVRDSRSANTAKAYRQALQAFARVLQKHQFDLNDPPSQLPEQAIVWLADALKEYAPATERLYLSAVIGFYEYLEGSGLGEPNLTRLRQLLKRRVRRSGQRLPQFSREAIEKVLDYAERLSNAPVENDLERLRNLRDRAFLLVLADTGLRVHEACKMRRGDLDWNEGKAILIGKGDKQSVIRFSTRSLEALQDYLEARSGLDGAARKPLGSLPLFLRHDPGAKKGDNQFKAMTTETGRNIVEGRVKESLGASAAGTITPHSFRHYFVTIVLRASGNLKVAQALARHSNISTTSLYAHLADDELDKAYWDTFEKD